jgi:hypothetical protein
MAIHFVLTENRNKPPWPMIHLEFREIIQSFLNEHRHLFSVSPTPLLDIDPYSDTVFFEEEVHELAQVFEGIIRDIGQERWTERVDAFNEKHGLKRSGRLEPTDLKEFALHLRHLCRVALSEGMLLKSLGD